MPKRRGFAGRRSVTEGREGPRQYAASAILGPARPGWRDEHGRKRGAVRGLARTAPLREQSPSCLRPRSSRVPSFVRCSMRRSPPPCRTRPRSLRSCRRRRRAAPLVLGAGKAGGAMAARGRRGLAGRRARSAAWSSPATTTCRPPSPRAASGPSRIEVVEAAHPVPDEAGRRAAGADRRARPRPDRGRPRRSA